MKKVFYYQTPVGKIGIAEEWGFITNLYFMNMKLPLSAKQIETDVIREAFSQLSEYLNGSRQEFDLPLNPSGTDFQQTVWSEILNISYGKTVSYKDNACNKNPIPIIIPCHRVVSSAGYTSGYVGGAELKEFLLKLEQDNGEK